MLNVREPHASHDHVAHKAHNSATPPVVTNIKATTPPTVRVLLDQTKGTQQHTWTLKSEGGFDLCCSKNAQSVFKHIKNELTISAKDGIVRIDGKRIVSAECEIIPKGEYVYFNNKPYKGSFLLCT